MNFLPTETVYECSKGRSKNYTSLAFQYDALTLNRNFVRHRFGTDKRTPFKEIAVASFKSVMDDDYKALMNVRRGQVFEGRAAFFSRIRAALKNAIEECWHPTAAHLMFHSSGLDSRVISFLLKELHREHGDDWLGTVVFCCSKWEGRVFKEIMKYEGWEPHQYMVAYEEQSDHDYYASSLLNFDGAWEWADGASPLAVNLYWYPALAAIEAGLIDRPIQTWSGQRGNGVFDYGSLKNGALSLDESTREFYNSILTRRPTYGDYDVRPYVAVPLVKVVFESSITLGHKLRPLLVEYIDSDLAQFVNMAADGDRHRRIADWILAQMRHDYGASWYGQKVKPNAKPKHRTTEFQDFWYHWTLASFCEELRRREIEIR